MNPTMYSNNVLDGAGQYKDAVPLERTRNGAGEPMAALLSKLCTWPSTSMSFNYRKIKFLTTMLLVN